MAAANAFSAASPGFIPTGWQLLHKQGLYSIKTCPDSRSGICRNQPWLQQEKHGQTKEPAAASKPRPADHVGEEATPDN